MKKNVFTRKSQEFLVIITFRVRKWYTCWYRCYEVAGTPTIIKAACMTHEWPQISWKPLPARKHIKDQRKQKEVRKRGIDFS